MRKIGYEGSEMLSLLPQWMKMSKEDSVGGSILTEVGNQLEMFKDAVRNITLDVLTRDYTRPEYREVDIFDVDFLYKFRLFDTVDVSNGIKVDKITNGKKVNLTEAESNYNFYKNENSFIYDASSRILYIRRIITNGNEEKFDLLDISGNQIAYESLELHHVWNPLDEIGLLLGCKRIHGEVNSVYKERLFDVLRSPGSSTDQGLISYLTRSLNITRDELFVKTFDDDYISYLTNADGSPTNELKEYIEISKKVNNIDSQYYWSALEDNNMGLNYLPMIWNDNSYGNWDDKDIHSGIGYDDDLEISFNESEKNEQSFDYNVWAEGLQNPDVDVYPEHKFKYKITASGEAAGKGYSPEQYHYKIKASELIPLIFDVIAHVTYLNKYKIETPVNNLSVDVTRNYKDVTDKNFIIGIDQDTSKDSIVLTDGTYCNNPAHKYLYLLANLFTKDDSKTPTLEKAIITYVVNDGTNDIQKTITVQGDSGITEPTVNNAVVGFKTNTWDDEAPRIRVKQDTNDMQQTTYNTATGKIQLSTGDYYKEYTSGGDWEDGLVRVNPETEERLCMNVKLNSKGQLTLAN